MHHEPLRTNGSDPPPLTVVPASARSLSITVAQDGDRLVLISRGDIDADAEQHFLDFLLAALDQSPSVVVDLKDIGFMDSSGLSALVGAVHSARQRGRAVTVRDPSGPVVKILELSGVSQILDIETTDANSTADR